MMALPSSLNLEDDGGDDGDDNKSSCEPTPTQQEAQIEVEKPDRQSRQNPDFPLCREKSFEGLLGSFMKTAAPKKAALRRKEENETNAPPERRSVGRTKSFEGMLQPQTSFRGGRRPNSIRIQGTADE